MSGLAGEAQPGVMRSPYRDRTWISTDNSWVKMRLLKKQP